MRKYGLLGKRLDYSFSKSFFEDKFEREQLEASYENIELDTLEEVRRVISDKELSGFNVTIPYKQSMIPFLDDISTEAREVGAVNTVLIQDGGWIGFNTDIHGFRQSIKPFLTNKHERALILGTGGAAKAVEFVLKGIGLDVSFLSSSREGKQIYSYDQVNHYMLEAHKLIVNCTPLGTFPDVEAKPPIELDGIGADHLLIDLIYNPEETLLLKEAKELGATTLNGLSMLKEQALQSWKIWNSSEPETSLN
ncbi:MAG: shikimate dehydrogenase [Bacteroidetes bacterium]|nr:MAG: shikimate dehydrogenase [Bacteroidota bacterium]